MNRDLWLRPHGSFDLTPAIIGENLVDLAAAWGCAEIPLPTQIILPITPYGLLVCPINGTRGAWDDGNGVANGIAPAYGGVHIESTARVEYSDTSIATTPLKMTMVLCADMSENGTIPQDTSTQQAPLVYEAHATMNWGHATANSRDVFFVSKSAASFDYRRAKYFTTLADMSAPRTWTSRYESNSDASAFVGGALRAAQNLTGYVGGIYSGNGFLATIGGFAAIPGNATPPGKYYYGAYFNEIALTDSQIAALGGDFQFAMTTPWQPQQYYYTTATAPSAPLNPFATPGDEEATSGCDDVATATSFNLYHSASTPVTTGDTKVTGADRTGETVTGLTNGLIHYFAWTAENGVGESVISSTVSATPAAVGKYTPSLILSDSQIVGSWRIDQMMLSQPTASLRLKEDRGTRNVKLPKRNFTTDLYPNAAANTIGQPIPCLIGPGRSLTAYLIDSTTNRFKIVDHGLVSFDGFRDDSGNPYTPDTLFLSSGEFIYTGWDGDSELFADATATGANPVDAVAVILTDVERGASLPISRLDTTSTGKGFGTTGARLKYVRGEVVRTGAEALDFSIGLYMNEVRSVEEWIKQVSAASFSTVFINRENLWQIKAWQPEPSEDFDEIRTIVGKPKYTWKMDSPVTRVVAKYAKQHGIDNVQAYEYKDDLLRQLRNLSEHASKEPDALPLSDRFSARYWAQRTVATRGVPRRVIVFQTTQEHKELEIGDFFRLVDDDLNLDTVFEAIVVSTAVGENPVQVTAIDVRGFGDTSGFWVGDSDPVWDDTWTDAEVIERRENSGFWTNEGGYADTDDALRSHKNSRWI